MLQESHSTETDERAWLREVNAINKGNLYFSHGSTRARGTLIFVSDDLGLDIIKVNNKESLCDDEGRICIVTGLIKDERVIIASIYAPNCDSTTNSRLQYIEFLNRLEKMLDSVYTPESLLIIGGDANIILNSHLDASTGGNPKVHVNVVERLETLLSKFNLLDLFREKRQHDKIFTLAPKAKMKMIYIEGSTISSCQRTMNI